MKTINSEYAKGALKSAQIVLSVVISVAMTTMWASNIWTFGEAISLTYVAIFNWLFLGFAVIKLVMELFDLEIHRVYWGKFWLKSEVLIDTLGVGIVLSAISVCILGWFAMLTMDVLEVSYPILVVWISSMVQLVLTVADILFIKVGLFVDNRVTV
jgi:hypothetical protein